VPWLNSFTGKDISFNPFTNPLLGLFLIGVAIVIGALAGHLSCIAHVWFSTYKSIKGLKPAGVTTGSSALRQGLVIVQFALSALLIVCTTVVYRQINFLHEKDLGFNKDQVRLFSCLR
jgi:putative ABC transport system permease protein